MKLLALPSSSKDLEAGFKPGLTPEKEREDPAMCCLVAFDNDLPLVG
jgi:hypothetical protein